MSLRDAKPLGATVLAVAMVITAGCERARVPAATADRVGAIDKESTSAASETPGTRQEPVPAVEAAKPSPVESVSKAPQNITFDTIKFPLEKNEDYQRSALTPAIEALDGRTVRLRGYILPSFQQSGLKQFVLVRDNMQCCFGPGAALYDCVVVDMKPGKSTDYTVRPVAVEGTFAMREFKDPDGKCLAIYHLDGEAVRF